MVKLVCGFVGELENLFEVEIDDSEPVTVLKKAIKLKNEDIKCPERNLQLFLAKTKNGRWLTEANAANVKVNETGVVPGMLDEYGNWKDFVRMAQLLSINNRTHFGANFQRCEGDIHVLVVVPGEMMSYRHEPRDNSRKWSEAFLMNAVKFNALPSVGSLLRFVRKPLPMKIRAKKKWLNGWNLRPELQNKLFVEDDTSPCMEVKSKLFGIHGPTLPRRGQTEDSYHVIWDMAFRNVLELIFSEARCSRESCESSTMMRPDFCCVLDGVCVFRGEEEAPCVGIDVAPDKLCSSFVWGFGDLPYMLGYVASEYFVTLLALNLDDEGVVRKTVIGNSILDGKRICLKLYLRC